MVDQTTMPGAQADPAVLKAQMKAAQEAQKAAKKAEKVAAKAAKKAGDSATGEKGSKKKLIIIIAVVVLVLVGFLFMRSRGSSAPVKPEPGAVVQLDPIYINLTGGHYLKLGMALQASKSAPKELEGAKALDAAIGIFSDKSMAELNTKTRTALKVELVAELTESYEGEVLDVYFTEFVMQ